MGHVLADAADFFQTEQIVNRKKSGFRAARWLLQVTPTPLKV